MKEENVFERLKKNSELSSLPQILAEVIRVTSREETSTKELAAANSLIFKQYMLMEEVLRDNREMQRQVARDEARKAALESIKALTVTLSHYINNASATIQGRAQVVQQSIEQGTVTDPRNIAPGYRGPPEKPNREDTKGIIL
ncbi:MAG: hypothetical protein GY950_04650 [bacterium]|nr:hypothetical protein [bacterium]